MYKLQIMQETTGKILVSMTSYPGRIKNVGISIFLLLEQQTLPPDEVHLWLAVPQFPNKEADLPEDLQKVIGHPKVKLHWLPENTYVHKRHEIFKIAAPEDCVFLIDDDVKYADNLIATVMGVHRKHPGCIVCYNNYAFHEYKGKRILYRNSNLWPGPHVNKVRWCGQSMIPASVYPKEVLNPIHQAIRNNTIRLDKNNRQRILSLSVKHTARLKCIGDIQHIVRMNFYNIKTNRTVQPFLMNQV